MENSNGRETLKLGPGGAKDDSFPSSRQQMIRPKHMLGGGGGGEGVGVVIIAAHSNACGPGLLSPTTSFPAQIDVLWPRACS